MAFLDAVDAEVVLAPPELSGVLAYHGFAVAEGAWNLSTSTRNIDEVKDSLPPWVVLHPDANAEDLLFMIENTDDFSLVRAGPYPVWRVLR